MRGYWHTTKTATTVDPSNVDKLMDASAMAVYNEMKKPGFIVGA